MRTLTCCAALMALLTGCSTMRTEVEINAPPQRVWRILADFESYPRWNPFFVSAQGSLRAGGNVDVVMQPVGKSSQSFSPTILEVRDGQQLAWRGRLFLPLLFDGTHHFVVKAVGTDRSLFVQYEEFQGIFVPFVSYEPYRLGWDKMNAALKQRAEAQETSDRAN
jgi:hypothetical protein